MDINVFAAGCTTRPGNTFGFADGGRIKRLAQLAQELSRLEGCTAGGIGFLVMV